MKQIISIGEQREHPEPDSFHVIVAQRIFML